MKKAIFWNRLFTLVLFILLLSNFSAFAQKTTVWIVNHAEKDAGKDAGLSPAGQQRAHDLAKTLKHDNVEIIYITGQKCSAQMADPLAQKARILPRVYTDSISKFVNIIKRNFAGKNILIVADHVTIMQFLNDFGVESPFDSLDENDFDQLFTITIKDNGNTELAVQYYGEKNHVTPIPPQYILDSYYPGYAPVLPGN